MPTTPLLPDLVKQRNAIRDWLRLEAPETYKEQAHLDEDSSERAYWSHGYQSALDDVIQLMAAREEHSAGTSTRLPERGSDACDYRAAGKRGKARTRA